MQGMSVAGIPEGVSMIKEEFPDIWRLTLGPGDFADTPPLEMKLLDPEQRLSKSYKKDTPKMNWRGERHT